MNIKLFAFSFILNILGLSAQDHWVIDKDHSSIQFTVDHIVISEVTGSFNSYSGSLSMKGDDFTTAKLVGEIEVKSIDTKNQQRDGSLKSPEFFDSDNYPKITFVSKSISKSKSDKYVMRGDLTIKNVTKEIELEVNYKGTVKFMGQTKTGIKAYGVINRPDFNLNYNPLLETGGAIIGKEVTIALNFEFAKQ